jgi:hypothetical protein
VVTPLNTSAKPVDNCFNLIPEIKLGKSYGIPGSSVSCGGGSPFDAIAAYNEDVYRKRQIAVSSVLEILLGFSKAINVVIIRE